MNVGLDVGYSHTKAVSGDREVQFASAVGTPDKARFSIKDDETIILTQPQHVQIGEGAVRQSRFLHRREDRGWIESDEWRHLFLASITELTRASRVDLRIITGLPIAFFDDKTSVQDRLMGSHSVQRDGHHVQVFQVVDARVIPQPFGALLSLALDTNGYVCDKDLASGSVGVIDVGGKTTNILSVHRMAEVGRETASVNVGAWEAVRGLREYMNTTYPGLDELRDHQVVDAIMNREVRYYGEKIDLSANIDDVLDPLADQVLAEASQLWNGGATLDAILVAGGGAHLLGPYVCRHFRHARVVWNPVFANAIGFYRLAQRAARES